MKVLSNIAGILAVVILLVTGIVSLSTGFDFKGESATYIRNDLTFGADFYTEMHSVTEDVKGRIVAFNNDFVYGLSSMFIVFGIASIGFSLFVAMHLLKSNIATDKKTTQVEVQVSPEINLE